MKTAKLWTRNFRLVILASAIGTVGAIAGGFALAFLVFDETFNDGNTVSNKQRHLFIFPSQQIEEGDFIWLFTHKEGEYATHKNTSNTTTHKFYWGLGNSIWKKSGDKVYVVHYDEWIMKSLEE